MPFDMPSLSPPIAQETPLLGRIGNLSNKLRRGRILHTLVRRTAKRLPIICLDILGLTAFRRYEGAGSLGAFASPRLSLCILKLFIRTASKAPQIVTPAFSSETSWCVAGPLDTLARHARSVSHRCQTTVERDHRTTPEQFLRQVALP